MKRILFTLFALLALAGSASAQTKLRTIQLGFHTNDGLPTCPNYGSGDSLQVYRGAGVATATTLPIDTTMTLDLRQFVMPGPPFTTVTLSDSLAWLRFSMVPDGTSPTVAADTLHVITQVSDDNVNWTTGIVTGPKISPVVATMGAAAVLETGTSNTFNYILRQIVGGATQSVFNYLGTGAPTANQLYGYRYMRFLVQGDHTGKYLCYVTGFVPFNAPPTAGD